MDIEGILREISLVGANGKPAYEIKTDIVTVDTTPVRILKNDPMRIGVMIRTAGSGTIVFSTNNGIIQDYSFEAGVNGELWGKQYPMAAILAQNELWAINDAAGGQVIYLYVRRIES